jgi:autotransporter-associated beta strand protein
MFRKSWAGTSSQRARFLGRCSACTAGAVLAATVATAAALLATPAAAQTTITQWNFDDSTLNPSTGSGTASNIGGTSSAFAAGIPGQGWNTSAYPSQGTGNGSAGVQFLFSTLGYQDLSFSFDHRASGTASRWAQLDYTLNGGTDWTTGFWNNSGGLSPSDTFYSFNVDFSGVTAANDNPDFGVRIVSIFSPLAFNQNSTTAVAANSGYMRANADAKYQPEAGSGTGNYSGGGTWRFDNVTLTGSLIPPPGAKDVTWNTSSGDWNTTAENWTGGGSTFANGDNVTFANSPPRPPILPGIGGTITVDEDGVRPDSLAITATTGTYTFTGGAIAGTTSLAKSGAGTAVLAAANSFSGGTTISGGVLQANSDAALGGGSVTLDGGTLRAGGTITGSRAITVAAGGGTIDTNGNAVSVASIGGTGPFTKDGAGTLTTLGYTAGQLDVAAGTLEINAGGTTLIGSGGSVEGTLVLGNARRFNFSDGTVGGSGTIEVTTPGAQLATAGLATPAINVVIEPDIVLNTSATTGDPISIGAVSGHSITVNGIISGDSDIRFSAGTSGGAGITTLNAPNTYNGNTEFNNAQSAVVRLGVENALPTTTGITWGVTQNSGSLDLNGFDQTLAFIATTANVTGGIANTGAAAVLTLNQDTDTVFGARIGQVSNVTNLTGWNNDISLVKSGTGTLTLTGSNSYTGPTSVLDGGLIIDGVIAGLVNVAAAGTIGGGGTVGGSLVMAGNGSKFVFDPLQTLTVNGASVSFLGPFGIGDLIGLDADTPLGIYTLIDGDATVITQNLLNLGSGNPFDLGGGKSAFFQTGSLQVAVVPEPATVALATAGLSLAALAARRRLRKA